MIAAYNEEDAIVEVLDALPTELCGHRVDADRRRRRRDRRHRGRGRARRPRRGAPRDQPRAGRRAAYRLRARARAEGRDRRDDGRRRSAPARRAAPAASSRCSPTRPTTCRGPATSASTTTPGGARDLGIRVLHRADQPGERRRHHRLHQRVPRDPRRARSRRLRLEEPRFSASELIIESARRGLRIREVSGAHPSRGATARARSRVGSRTRSATSGRSSGPGGADDPDLGVTRPGARVTADARRLEPDRARRLGPAARRGGRGARVPGPPPGVPGPRAHGRDGERVLGVVPRQRAARPSRPHDHDRSRRRDDGRGGDLARRHRWSGSSWPEDVLARADADRARRDGRRGGRGRAAA